MPVDYHQIIDMLKDYYRVIIHDHAGFGFSDEPKEKHTTIFRATKEKAIIWTLNKRE